MLTLHIPSSFLLNVLAKVYMGYISLHIGKLLPTFRQLLQFLKYIDFVSG